MSDDSKRRARGRPREQSAAPAGSRVKAVDRALDVFKLVAQEGAATLTVIAATVELPYSTTHRILETLRAHDLVFFDEARQTWAIGVEAFRIGQSYARRATYVDIARPIMKQLTDETGETSNLAVLDGHHVVYVSQVETSAPIRAFFPPGSRGELRGSGIGKALLAHIAPASARSLIEEHPASAYTANTLVDDSALFENLATIHARGWGVDDEERYDGMRCIAAPIFNAFGEAIAGLSISGPSLRLDDNSLTILGPKIKSAADQITLFTGGRQSSG